MKNLRNKPKKIHLTIFVVAFLILAALGYFTFNKLRASSAKDNQINETIDLGPPTEQERRAGDKQKENIIREQEDQQEQSDINKVEPVITSAGQFDSNSVSQIEVRAFIPSIYESDGKCTAVFTQGDSKLTRTVEAISEATTTRCDVIVIPRLEFPSRGSWSVYIKYSSPKSSGSSKVTMFEVK